MLWSRRARRAFSASLALAWSFRTCGMVLQWGSGVMKISGRTSGRAGQAGHLPLFFWILPDWARVEVVRGGGGDGSEFWWWLSTEVGGFGGKGLVRVMGVGTRVWSSSGWAGRRVWFT